MDKQGEHMETNVDYFHIQKWMLQTIWTEKSWWKKWGHLFSFYVSLLSYGPQIVQKSAVFCNFLLTLARSLSLLKQFTYIHLKVLITLF